MDSHWPSVGFLLSIHCMSIESLLDLYQITVESLQLHLDLELDWDLGLIHVCALAFHKALDAAGDGRLVQSVLPFL